MLDWARLKGEPAKLRAAVEGHNRRAVAACVERVGRALTAADGAPKRPAAALERPSPSQYMKLTEAARALEVHPKTALRWLEAEAPACLLKHRRLILVHRARFAAWLATHHAERAG